MSTVEVINSVVTAVYIIGICYVVYTGVHLIALKFSPRHALKHYLRIHAMQEKQRAKDDKNRAKREARREKNRPKEERARLKREKREAKRLEWALANTSHPAARHFLDTTLETTSYELSLTSSKISLYEMQLDSAARGYGDYDTDKIKSDLALHNAEHERLQIKHNKIQSVLAPALQP